jgi:hypothetical protein
VSRCSPRLALDHRRAQHQVGPTTRIAGVVEGQHVGGVVLAAVIAVQRTALVLADDAHGDLRRRRAMRRAPSAPPGGAAAGAVPPIGHLQRQLQRRQRHRL